MRGLVLLLLVTLFLSEAIYSQERKRVSETGLSVGIGNSMLLNDGFHPYFTRKYNPFFDYAVFYKMNNSKQPISWKFEFFMQAISSSYEFSETTEGVIEQGYSGLNFKGSLNLNKQKDDVFKLFFGVGVYSVGQNRIPHFSSNLKMVQDGLLSYCGISFNGELTSSLPIDRSNLGVSWRFFIYPSITFLNRYSVPEFYHFGSSIAIFYSI